MTKLTMRRASFIAACAVLLAAGSASALDQLAVGDRLGDTDEAIQEALESRGFTVEEIEREDGGFEVEVAFERSFYEIEIHDGFVTEIENESDDDSGADDD